MILATAPLSVSEDQEHPHPGQTTLEHEPKRTENFGRSLCEHDAPPESAWIERRLLWPVATVCAGVWPISSLADRNPRGPRAPADAAHRWADQPSPLRAHLPGTATGSRRSRVLLMPLRAAPIPPLPLRPMSSTGPTTMRSALGTGPLRAPDGRHVRRGPQACPPLNSGLRH